MSVGPTDVTLWLELEHRCNIKCDFCYNYWKDGQTRRSKALPSRELRDCLARLLDEIDCVAVALSGGEPLLHRDLDAYVKLFSDRRISVVLTTNGVLADDSRLSELRECGLTSVQVPLHSANPEVHNALSGADCWHRSVAALASARQLGLDSIGVFVATRPNLQDLEGVLEILFLLGLNRLIVNRFIASGAGLLHRSALDVTDADILHALRRADPHAQQLGITIELGVRTSCEAELAQLPSVRVPVCGRDNAHQKYTVDFAGNLKHCNQSPYALGNLVDTPFSELAAKVSETKRALADNGAGSCYCAAVTQI